MTLLQTTILDTEVVFVDPQVAQWGLENILGEFWGSSVVELDSDMTSGNWRGHD